MIWGGALDTLILSLKLNPCAGVRRVGARDSAFSHEQDLRLHLPSICIDFLTVCSRVVVLVVLVGTRYSTELISCAHTCRILCLLYTHYDTEWRLGLRRRSAQPAPSSQHALGTPAQGSPSRAWPCALCTLQCSVKCVPRFFIALSVKSSTRPATPQPSADDALDWPRPRPRARALPTSDLSASRGVTPTRDRAGEMRNPKAAHLEHVSDLHAPSCHRARIHRHRMLSMLDAVPNGAVR